MTNGITTAGLLRLIGIMGICVGAAWALQVLGLGGSTAFGHLMWVVSAAAIAGAGVGLVYTSVSLYDANGAAKA